MTYSLAQVLTVYVDKLLCPVDDLFAIVSGILGRDIFPHELPAAFRECRPWILAHHPEFGSVDGTTVTPDNWESWLASQVAVLGPTRDIPPVRYSPLAEQDPMDTLEALAGAERIIVIEGL